MKKTIAVLVVLLMVVGSAQAALFETGFEDYTADYADVVGQDGWTGWNSPAAVVATEGEDAYMPGFNFLWIGPVGRDTQALYRPFAAQTGQVRLEVLYRGYQSETSWRSISLRDSSEDNAPFAAMIGSSKNYDSGYREFFAYSGDGREWYYTGTDIDKADVFKIVIDANVATQTYDATVSRGDDYISGTFTEVASWTGVSFANTVSDISRVYVQSWDSVSLWDNFLITPEPATLAVLALGGFAVLLRRKR